MIRYTALLFGIVIVVLGLLGLAAPQTFLGATSFFQTGNRIFLAAAGRILIGIVVIAAASESRWPRGLRIAGGFLVLIGLLTPVSTHPLPSVAWGWWPGNFVRPWAFSTILLGGFIVAASAPPRDSED